jgi:thiamine pyrophosphate-dependent acetolactate synthase large subunit-like protein
VFGIGCSFVRSSFATPMPMPKGKRIAHSTLDPTDINKDVPVELAAVGDAGLTLDALLEEVKDRLHGKTRDRLAAVTGRDARAEAGMDGAVDASSFRGTGSAREPAIQEHRLRRKGP